MRILRITLTNFKRHQSFDVEVKPGLIGLLGPNGSGKSSFLSSMAFAITGTPLSDEPLRDLITWGKKSGSVDMSFEHGGVVYALSRPISKPGASLDGSDGSSVKGIVPVNTEMQRMSGTPFDLFKGIMFVAQDALDAPLKGTEAARKEAFGRLFNCQVFDRYRDILQGGVMRASAAASRTGGKTIEELEKEIEDADAKYREAEQRARDIAEELRAYDLPSLYRTAKSVPMDHEGLEDARRKMAECSSVMDSIASQGFLQNDRDGLVRRSEYLKSVLEFHSTGKCPFCGHEDGQPPIPRDQADKELRECVFALSKIDEYKRAEKEWLYASQLCERITSSGVTQQEITEANNKIKQHETLDGERLKANSQVGWFAGLAKTARDRLAEEKRIREEAARAGKVLEDLEAVRSAFHRDAVQQAVRSYGARLINDRLQSYLAIFNLPYRPSFGNDGLMKFLDIQTGTEHEFSKLSGGEQKLTALAYRLALMQMFSGNVRVAILDEPTYGVDRRNLETMCESFRALSDYAVKRGLSIFVATHEEALFPAFDQTIEL